MKEPLRSLPSVEEVLSRPSTRALESRVGRAVVKASARAAIAQVRAGILAGAKAADVSDELVARLAEEEDRPRLQRVINATGVVLHTNLGRAPLHPEAAQAAAAIASGYSNLELDLATGKRGHRSAHLEPLLCELFGAEAAHVVNNCAGAALLGLSALGAGGRAIVSRGELVEIGGGFRVPEILQQSGMRLVEVGTTNRTRLPDYEKELVAGKDATAESGPGAGAPGSGPALLLRVHRSNFALVGFTEEPKVADLARLAHAHGALLLHDLGSGALDPALGDFTAAQSLREGADVVMVSGDKLLGGPQAGILLGKRALIERCRTHPLARALRADKMLLAALEATLRVVRRGDLLPSVAALRSPPEEERRKATRLALELQQLGVQAAVVECEGQVGGGSLPLVRLPGAGVALEGPAAQKLAALRAGKPPVLALVRDEKVLLDVRCVTDLAELARVVAAAGDANGPQRATLDEEATEV